MVKTKVQDLATEFGIGADQLLTLLRDMGVTARSAASALDDSQVSAVRVRWEREKRRQAEPAATPKKTIRRKTAKAAEPEPEPPSRPDRSAVAVPPPKWLRRRHKPMPRPRASPAEEAIVFDREKAAAAFERVEPVSQPMGTIEQRPRALFKDLPPVAVEEGALTEAGEAPPPVSAEASIGGSEFMLRGQGRRPGAELRGDAWTRARSPETTRTACGSSARTA